MTVPSVLAVLGRSLAALLLAAATVVIVVRLLGLDRGFPLSAIMTVFPYVVGLAAVVAVACFLVGWRLEAWVAGPFVLAGVALLIPRLLAGPTPASEPAGPTFTVAVANLRVGGGDAATVVAGVERYDVDALVVLELTEDAIERLEDAGLNALLAHTTLVPSRLTSGGGIYSRHPLEARPPSRQRRFGGTPRAVIMLSSQQPVELHAVHPLPPISRSWVEAWREALADLPPPGAGEQGGPLRILAGDFNATADHSVFRDVLARGWVDAADAVGSGLRPTFSALGYGEPVPPVALDHVLVDERTAVQEVAVEALPRSDHRMLVVRLRLPSPAAPAPAGRLPAP